MKLHAITVSVQYDDFLLYALEENYKLFDRWIIVTDSKDKATQDLVLQYADKNVQLVITDSFYDDGASFNKYNGIVEGLKYVDPDAWILFIDSDIICHYEMRRTLEHISLDESCLYGIDRINCQGIKQWNIYQEGKGMLKENWLLHTEGLELGARLVHHYGHEGENGRFEGWRPLGFFQLAHRSAFDTYPTDSLCADHCDLQFARLWPRSKRIMIPELFVVHLESEHAGKAVNWWGRKSQRFEVKEEPIIEPQQQVNETPQQDPIINPQITQQAEQNYTSYISVLIGLLIDLLKQLIQKIKTIFTKKNPPSPPHYYGD